MDEYEKWLDFERIMKGQCKSYYRPMDEITFSLGEEQAYGTALSKYRSMTCTMRGDGEEDGSYHLWECGKCGHITSDLYKPRYCNQCGRKVVE